ncbi:hypothetical protein GQ600_11041 [Phytophthora cactorum]|nr:hypothetical protein GQ600_11041 [Phytophthora cactorum]
MAHVSAQTHDIAEYQVVLYATQQLQAQQQQLYTEAQVQQARAEAESRTEVLAEMIQATRIDPAAIEQHAISVANDVAQTQGRAVAEAHAAQHAKFSDIRMAEAFKQMEIQLHTRLEQQMREVPTAHMEQVQIEAEPLYQHDQHSAASAPDQRPQLSLAMKAAIRELVEKDVKPARIRNELVDSFTLSTVQYLL